MSFAQQRRNTCTSVCQVPNIDVFNQIQLNTATPDVE